MLQNGIVNVLELESGKDWIQIRRELTDDKISKIYTLYEGLWPLETDLLALLPKPDGEARAVCRYGDHEPEQEILEYSRRRLHRPEAQPK